VVVGVTLTEPATCWGGVAFEKDSRNYNYGGESIRAKSRKKDGWKETNNSVIRWTVWSEKGRDRRVSR